MSRQKLTKQQFEQRLLDRRQFLIGTGSAVLSLPPLLSLMSSTAAAQALAQKKVRSIIYVGLQGINEDLFYPSNVNGETVVPGVFSTYTKPLNTFSGPISRVIDTSFQSMYSQMNLMRGLSLTCGQYQGHNEGMLGGFQFDDGENPRGRSIDVIMERSSGVYRPEDNVPRKAVRIIDHSHLHPYSYLTNPDGTRTLSGILQGDRQVFNYLFSGLPTSAPTTTVNPAVTQDNTNDKLIVDRVYSDLKSLENNSRLSREDKTLLDRYISSIFDLQKKINTSSSGGGSSGPQCIRPTMNLNAQGDGNYYYFPSDAGWRVTNSSVVYDNYIEIIKLAFMCDLTRVIYIGNNICTDNPQDPQGPGGTHHECPSAEIAADKQQWGIKKMLKLAQTLNGVTDPQNSSGTVLDNSTILITNELGDWTTGHKTLSMPVITFGSGGGFFKTGQYVDYDQRNYPNPNLFSRLPGRPFKQLLQSIMLSMGVPRSEYMLYGDGTGFGEFKRGINQFQKVDANAFAPYVNEHNDKLPFIT
ncbi:DUF1552 domain-containing protein, partial [bacterium]|nr:DUF1552 domain-containing protein [bacterium]